MGYQTHYSGEVTITPPLEWHEFKDSPFLEANLNFGLGGWKDVCLRVDEDDVETDQGVLTKKISDAVVPIQEDPYKGYEIETHLKECIESFPYHNFEGQLDAEGEDAGDLWRLVVRNSMVRRVNAQIVWPEDMGIA
jgi:hypothetical protein